MKAFLGIERKEWHKVSFFEGNLSYENLKTKPKSLSAKKPQSLSAKVALQTILAERSEIIAPLHHSYHLYCWGSQIWFE